MKAFKKFLIVGLIIIATASFNNVTAQTFGGEVSSEINQRQRLIINLLKQEIQNNNPFNENAESIKYELKFASERDTIAPDCYKYTPLLVNILNSNVKFSNYYNIQGNFGYGFVNKKNQSSIGFNFYEHYNENGNFSGLDTTISIQKDSINQNLENKEAIDYITSNYCKPLNQILDQNANLSVPQLLNILRQRFSR